MTGHRTFVGAYRFVLCLWVILGSLPESPDLLAQAESQRSVTPNGDRARFMQQGVGWQAPFTRLSARACLSSRWCNASRSSL